MEIWYRCGPLQRFARDTSLDLWYFQVISGKFDLALRSAQKFLRGQIALSSQTIEWYTSFRIRGVDFQRLPIASSGFFVRVWGFSSLEPARMWLQKSKQWSTGFDFRSNC
jgi:hypothetical protein